MPQASCRSSTGVAGDKSDDGGCAADDGVADDEAYDGVADDFAEGGLADDVARRRAGEDIDISSRWATRPTTPSTTVDID